MTQQRPINSSHSNLFQPHAGSASADPSQGAIDWRQLHEIADGSREFEQELLQIFVADSLVHLDSLKQAVAAQNCWKAEQAAHHIKGASASVGAVVMQAIATEIEQRARQKQIDGSDRLLTKLESALQKIQTLAFDYAAHSDFSDS